MCAILIERLTKIYGDSKVKALDNISYRYDGSEGIIIVMGPSGAGKTTLFKIVSGLMKPTSGKVKIFDFNLPDDYRKARRIISYLPEDPRPFFYTVTVRDQILCYLLMRGMDKSRAERRVKELAEHFELDKLLDRKMANLSEGEVKRVFLISTLAVEARIYVLDEPHTHLDPYLRLKLWRILDEMRHDEKLILLSTHILDEVPTYCCDEVMVLFQGKLRGKGKPKDLMSKKLPSRKKIILKVHEHMVKDTWNILRNSKIKDDIVNVVSIGTTFIIYPKHTRLISEIVEALYTGAHSLKQPVEIEVSNITLNDYVLTSILQSESNIPS